jgi:cyclopropane-fatty-acyl-phospholipid synthase
MSTRETIVPPAGTPGIRVIPNSMSGVMSRIGRKALMALLRKLERGNINIVEGESRTVFGEASDRETLSATVYVNDTRFYTDMFFGGSIGAGESYMAGFWRCDDLTQLIRIIIMNRNVFNQFDGGPAKLTAPIHRLLHFLRNNTKEGSRKNIAAHYDLGNDFYSLFLDETMTYSCAIFNPPGCSLAEASIEKYDRICRKLDLSPGDHVLEIGAGWGGFAIHAAKQYGCRVTTTTISRQQYEFARQRIWESGLNDRIELLSKDYRDLEGKYDRVVSIEMIEAVGHNYLDTFLKCCSERLKDDGLMLLQCITIEDHAYEAHIRSADFIKRYIFPGSFIPSIRALSRSVAGSTDLRIADIEDITAHYVTTLSTWRERFFKHIGEVQDMGYPQSFINMWEYYLCYCEAGFAERYLGDIQMLLTKPLSKRTAALPLQRG